MFYAVERYEEYEAVVRKSLGKNVAAHFELDSGNLNRKLYKTLKTLSTYPVPEVVL
jgi:hypothetical protein